LVLEVNASPGLEGIETVTGVNVADEVIGHLEAVRTQPDRGTRPSATGANR